MPIRHVPVPTRFDGKKGARKGSGLASCIMIALSLICLLQNSERQVTSLRFALVQDPA